jgi:DNA repair ATPase RecN
LTPEERQKRLHEFREKHPAMAGPVRDELEKHREELKKLPPEERQAKIKELREKIAERAQGMTPEQRKNKRHEIRQRFETQLNQLREKKTNGTISPLESRRLQRLETVQERFKEAQKE